MWLIIVSLIMGIALGVSGKVPERIYGQLDRVTTVTLFVMLAALGAQIGGNDELLNNLTIIGQRALLIAGLSVAGSIGALWLVVRYFGLSGQERDPS